MIELNGLAGLMRNVTETRQKKGTNIKVDARSMLKHCATEVVEAMEACGNYLSLKQYADFSQMELEQKWLGMEEPDSCEEAFQKYKKNFSAVLADIITCVMIIASGEGIDIEQELNDCFEKNRKKANGEGDKL